MRDVQAVVLAAGKGKRMVSNLPKVLHKICGRPMIAYVLETLAEVGVVSPIVVIGHEGDQVRKAVGDGVRYVVQAEQLGTGHAAMQALPALEGHAGTVLLLYGDAPFLRAETIETLLSHHQAQGAAATVLTDLRQEPAGYGRVVRDGSGNVRRIVEDADASAAEREIHEINAGTYAFDTAVLREALHAIRPANAQGEYYLTDVIELLLQRDRTVAAVVAGESLEASGINSRRELAAAEAAMRQILLGDLMDGGVTVIDPATTFVHAGVRVGRDTILHPGTSLEGATVIGESSVIGPNARITDSQIGDRVTIEASTIVGSVIADDSRVGPYSRLRPGVRLGRFVDVGNYAEMKNATIGDRTKVHHMSYIGDATIGADVNIGAGTITCNFDGRTKHLTVIEDGAFIGSDSMLVAPIRVGRGAVTGAGAVVTKDVPARSVAVGVPARVIRHLPSADLPVPEPVE